MKERISEVKRKTAETDISLKLDLGGGETVINTGCGFLDHMLTLFSAHSGFGLKVSCEGDTYVDYHHSVEDIGICLGQAFCGAIGGKEGIRRYGSMILPMDEALILAAVDISGRSGLFYDISVPAQKVGDFDTELCREFFAAFTRQAQVTLHLKQLAGENSHHIIEGAFKAFARCLKEAVSVCDADGKVPSTKGVL